MPGESMPGSETLNSLRQHPGINKAFSFIRNSETAFTAEQIRICEIPAPTFAEQERGEYIAARFRDLGLAEVEIDLEGNVCGLLHGQADDILVAVSAHLDTVFPLDTDVRVRRYAAKLVAPGIGDNASGLAAMIAMIEAIKAAGIRPRGSILFVATVGEEGEGDLRGARFLFTQHHLAGRITHFISFDGPGCELITTQALGSRRYRITLEGPGGHSWTDFGVVNPIHALGRAIARLSELSVPFEPRTTYNVGRIVGGSSVNVIPERASIDVDIRSVEESELSRVEDFLLSSVNFAVRAENSIRAASHQGLKVDVNLIGHRPSGDTSRNSRIVELAIEATKAVGFKPLINCASTDANIPISMGIPAITIGAGGKGGDAHRLSEWYDPAGRDRGYQRALLLILGLTGLAS